MEKIVLLDGHSILNRAYYGVPDLSNSQGLHTNAVFGFLNIMFKILDEEKPEFLAVAFDVKAPTFRHELYQAYKGTRKPMPEELREQVPVMKEVLTAMGICILEQAGLEADDILGTLAGRADRDGLAVALVSGDRDLLQIASERIKIRIPKTRGGKTEVADYYASDVLSAYQVTPQQFIDVKALMGDASDNIPGVPKVGEKTATELIVRFGSLEQVYEHLEEITKKAVKESLAANREAAELSKVLATIKVDGAIDFDYAKAAVGNFYTKEAYRLFKELEFKNMLGRFGDDAVFDQDEQGGEARCKFVPVTDLGSAEAIFDRVVRAVGQAAVKQDVSADRSSEGAAPFASTTPFASTAPFASAAPFVPAASLGVIILEDSPADRDFCGLALALSDEEVYYFGAQGFLTKAYLVGKLRELTGKLAELTGKVLLATFDIKKKYDYFISPEEAAGQGTGITAGFFDILIGAYLLNPLKSDYEAEDIANQYLGIVTESRAQLFGKTPLTAAAATVEGETKLSDYACSLAHICRKAAPILRQKLAETGMMRLMDEIEMPLSYVLHDMEKAGVMVRPEELKSYGAALSGRIGELERLIYQQAGTEFNINSPKQLGEILFERLKLPGGKKTKTGYSTAADVLERLEADHPIIKDILEYRGLTKLKSTYADGLAVYIEADDRIHTNLKQTITATGRLSSTEPNLQNIPMRMELGRLIRKVFVPAAGCVFMDADYSQIELRILAHLSGDEQLIEAYRMEEDIHRITAAKVFHTPFAAVTDLQRRNAKAVNFGIVYGISSFGLSQDLSIARKEAEAYIEQYFATYPKVRQFLTDTVEAAKKDGYVTTIFGRRRPIPELTANQYMRRSFGERVAMNSPIQGAAADIIKIAMIRVWDRLHRENRKSRLVLQIHDELLLEVPTAEIEPVRQLLREEMKGAARLAVVLEIDLNTGSNWYQSK